MKNRKPSILRSLGIGLGILAALVVYAYGFQVTKVNLEETKSEHRQAQLFRILRALARPNLLEYEKQEFRVVTSIMVPCPVEGYEPAPPEDSKQPYLIVTPACSDPRTEVHVEGFNFEPLTRGPLNFVPIGSGVNLQLATIEPDRNGHFEVTARLPNRPSEEEHELVAITRRNMGAPSLTQTAYDTWDKIIETVFLALLATTLGVMIAIPLSFFAARNLMKDVTSSLLSASLSILFIPIGVYLGMQLAGFASRTSLLLIGNDLLTLGSIVIGFVLVWLGIRWALPQREISIPSVYVRFARLIVLIIVGFLGIVTLYLVSSYAYTGGESLGERFGNFGFLGRFVRDLGDILNMVIKVMTALVGAGIFSSLAGRLGGPLSRKSGVWLRGVHILLAAAAGAVLMLLIAAAINWMYQFRDFITFYSRMAAVGGVLGLIVGWRIRPSDPVPTGIVIYYVSRTIFNALRSIEALVMAIVFVVWVGIGPFAGSLALALHTIAALAKLYSEQVESIMAGPLEAVQATGATRLQTIVYAVLPQIVPPYISFTMYRWDINVRMSTIIGFAGGGGIGFLLQQNINLLNYRDASAQMLAIAVVVAAMDFVSSKLRENVV